MRIQHNVMAMNAYRNYNNNTSALSKNLEKLSSGYKINRAGDDAAGLAISEKMRAQISGLTAAQKNVKDGVSLVKTAEGAMQEIQDMLNRMVYLGTQSANGTYDNEVDRANLQKEVNSLKSEIDRIADSANFNGIKLLDGSLAGAASVDGLEFEEVAAAGSSTAFANAFATITGAVGNASLTYTFTIQQGGSSKDVDITLDISDDGTKLLYKGEEVGDATANGAGVTDDHQFAALQKVLAKHEAFKDITVGGTKDNMTFTSKTVGADAPAVTAINSFDANGVDKLIDGTMTTTPTDAHNKTDMKNLTGMVFTVNGQKFMLATPAQKANAGKGIHVVDATNDVATDAEVKALAARIAKETGYAPRVEGTELHWEDAGKGLELQIGDTSDSYNQLKVSVGDMHSAALGIGSISIADQSSAAAAIDQIKAAINTVSSTRGDLGATQNRLEHTLNNLSVMTENITDAESTIRDTDVADEMMAYTKNNILIQSAQAMLAQANQVPQGVLQLLQ